MLNKLFLHQKLHASGSYNSGSYVPPHTYTTASFYIIAGQSNCGRAEVSQMSSSQSSVYAHGTIPNQYILDPGYSSSYLAYPLTPGTNTMLYNYNNLDEFGPETALATSFASASNQPRYYLKLGVGSTYLSGSAPTDWFPGDLYNNQLKTYINYIITQAKLSYVTLNLKGFVWMQGENDASVSASAVHYGDNLTTFFSDFDSYWRSTMNLFNLPSSSYTKVIGRISSFGDGSEIYRANVRAAQQNYCSTSSNNAVMINTDAYPTASDGTHYNATGQIQFGLDIYSAIGSL